MIGLAKPHKSASRAIHRSGGVCRQGVLKCGEVPEWSNGAVSKTVVRFAYPGFESLSLRQLYYPGKSRFVL